MKQTRICPLCWQPVRPTKGGNIQGHWDSTGKRPCPMSYENYELVEIREGMV